MTKRKYKRPRVYQQSEAIANAIAFLIKIVLMPVRWLWRRLRERR